MNQKPSHIAPLNPDQHKMMLLQTQENVNKKTQHDDVVVVARKGPIKMGVTAAILAANGIFYFRPKLLHPVLPAIEDVGFQPYLIIHNKDLKRLFLSAFYHRSDMHVFRNMFSLLMNGILLEESIGSVEFASTVASLLVMSHGIALGLSKLLAQFSGCLGPYFGDDGVGFSCVLVAMEVVQWWQLADEVSRSFHGVVVHGFVVPLLRFFPWLNLVPSQVTSLGPYCDISFLGHLSGAIAGVFYLFFKGAKLCPNPLTIFVRGLADLLITLPKKLTTCLFAFRRR